MVCLIVQAITPQNMEEKFFRNCNVVDDETHRINHCTLYWHMNHCHSPKKIIFDNIYSKDETLSYEIVKIIMSMWDLENGKNEIFS